METRMKMNAGAWPVLRSCRVGLRMSVIFYDDRGRAVAYKPVTIMAIYRQLFQFGINGMRAAVLAILMSASTPVLGETMLQPENSFNAVTVSEQLNMSELRPYRAPDIDLGIDRDTLADSFPYLDVSGYRKSRAGEWDVLDIRFQKNGTPVAAIQITRVEPPDAMDLAVRRNFAMFSAPVRLAQYPDASLDRLAAITGDGGCALAIRGPFLTIARGDQSVEMARTITKLLFE